MKLNSGFFFKTSNTFDKYLKVIYCNNKWYSTQRFRSLHFGLFVRVHNDNRVRGLGTEYRGEYPASIRNRGGVTTSL